MAAGTSELPHICCGGWPNCEQAVRKTSSTVPQELTIGDVKVQVLHVADRIRKYAPFPSHANEAITNNKENGLEYPLHYSDYPEVSLTDIALQEQGELDGEAVTFILITSMKIIWN